MIGIHQALGFADEASLADPQTIYLGNDNAACNQAVDEAIESKEFKSILRHDNFTHSMRRTALQAPVLSKIDCSPEGQAAHHENLRAVTAAEAKRAEDAKAETEAKRTKFLEESRAANSNAEDAPTLEEVAALLAEASAGVADGADRAKKKKK